MNDVKVRFITDIGNRRNGDEAVVAWFISQALVRDGLAVIIEEVTRNETKSV